MNSCLQGNFQVWGFVSLGLPRSLRQKMQLGFMPSRFVLFCSSILGFEFVEVDLSSIRSRDIV